MGQHAAFSVDSEVGGSQAAAANCGSRHGTADWGRASSLRGLNRAAVRAALTLAQRPALCALPRNALPRCSVERECSHRAAQAWSGNIPDDESLDVPESTRLVGGTDDDDTAVVGHDLFPWGGEDDKPAADPCCRATFVVFMALAVVVSISLGGYSYSMGTILKLTAASSAGAAAGGAAVSTLAVVLAVLTGAAAGLAATALLHLLLVWAGGYMVDVSFWSLVVLFAVTAVALLASPQTAVAGALCLFLILLLLVLGCCLRRSWQLARGFVSAAVLVLVSFPGLYAAATVFVMVELAFAVAWAHALLGVIAIGTEHPNNQGLALLAVFSAVLVVFGALWASATGSAVVSVMTARCAALWWMAGDVTAFIKPATPTGAMAASAAGWSDTPEPTVESSESWQTRGRPVAKAASWAAWAALGPASFASLVVSALQLVELVIGVQDDSIAKTVCGVCVRMARSIVQYYNSFLFAVVGVARGSRTLSTREAASILHSLATTGSVAKALFNDSLVTVVIFFCVVLGSVFAGGLAALSGVLVAFATGATGERMGVVVGACLVAGLVVGFLSTSLLMSLVRGAVKALFVLYIAKDAVSPSIAASSTSIATADSDGEGYRSPAATKSLRSVHVPLGRKRTEAFARLEAAIKNEPPKPKSK